MKRDPPPNADRTIFFWDGNLNLISGKDSI
jgi:hypothetical protein